jgi:hypothetical protein
MDKHFIENVKYLAQLQSLMQFIQSEECKEILEEMGKDDFSSLDVTTMTEEEENLLKFVYQSSFLNGADIFPEYVKEAFANVRKRLQPLFEDQTEYLMREPNGSILLKSLEEVKNDKLHAVDWL